MRAISLHQPWASMIAKGEKTIETRMWPTNVRGDVLICSSQSPKVEDLPCGFAVSIVEIVDCRPMTEADEDAACCLSEPGRYSWVLANIRPLPVPFRVKGKQGFFNVSFGASLLFDSAT